MSPQQERMEVAKAALDGSLVEPTGGATYCYAPEERDGPARLLVSSGAVDPMPSYFAKTGNRCSTVPFTPRSSQLFIDRHV
jgi:hypothetical protein